MNKCKLCNKEISGDKIFCSRNCYYLWLKDGKNNPGYGKHWSWPLESRIERSLNNPSKRPEVREKIRQSSLGNKNPLYGRTKANCPNLARAGREHSIVMKEKYASGELKPWNIGLTKETDERLKNVSLKTGVTQKQKYLDPEYREMMIKKTLFACDKKPNKSEIRLDDLFQKYYPNEWKFVGDGQIWIAGKCPDFINVNGQKKIVEFYGDYWHASPLKYKENDVIFRFGKNYLVKDIWERDRSRLEIFKKYGFSCLVIWQHELKDKNLVIKKIKNFMDDIKI